MFQIHFDQISNNQFWLYNTILLIGYSYLLLKFGRDFLSALIITLFFYGMFSDIFGETGTKLYKITTLLWSFALFLYYPFVSFIKNHKTTSIILSITCILFVLISIIVHNDNILLVLSQLSKLLIPFFIFSCLYNVIKNDNNDLYNFNLLFRYILISQIIFSFVKVLILGSFMEGWVGSLTGIRGGAIGTSLPLAGLCWFALQKDMKEFNINDILFIIGLLFIGFSTGKRAIWFLFPLLFIIFIFWVYRHNSRVFIYSAIFVIPMIYLGIRVSPTLNPDKKVWGNFDIKYAIEYALEYSRGEKDLNKGTKEGQGRIGAVKWMSNQISNGTTITYAGLGNEYLTYMDSEDYFNSRYYFGIESKGSITYAVKIFMSCGIFILISFIIYIISILNLRNRYSYTLIFIVLFDCIFYQGCLFESTALFVLVLFLNEAYNNILLYNDN